MYIVRFVRVDGCPAEEYYYQREADAKYHLALFLDDDSGLYSKVSIISVDENDKIGYNKLDFDAMM